MMTSINPASLVSIMASIYLGLSIPWSQSSGLSIPGLSIPGLSIPGLSIPGLSVPGTVSRQEKDEF